MNAKWVKRAGLFLLIALAMIFRWSSISEIKDTPNVATLIYKRDLWTGRVWVDLYTYNKDEKQFHYARRLISETGWPWMPSTKGSYPANREYANSEYAVLTWAWAGTVLLSGAWFLRSITAFKPSKHAPTST
jgi:hypothetical protein